MDTTLELHFYKLLNSTKDRILNLLIQEKDQRTILEAICNTIETNDPELYCSILIANQEKKALFLGAGPRIPKEYSKSIEGIEILENVGSCPHAAYTKKTVIASDLYNHPNWMPYTSLIKQTDFLSCWSEPFFDSDGSILGTFAIYKKKISSPSSHELEFIKSISHFVSLVIKHCQIREENKYLKKELP